MNSIFKIDPYKDGVLWVFDDQDAGLNKEPFVPSAGMIIDRIVKDAKIANAEQGFTLLFSDNEFPDSHKLTHVGEECCGNWYKSEKYNMKGWLCPALFNYFIEAPQSLYIQALPK